VTNRHPQLTPLRRTLPRSHDPRVGRGQYRNAVASGDSRNCNDFLVNEEQGRPDATALRY